MSQRPKPVVLGHPRGVRPPQIAVVVRRSSPTLCEDVQRVVGHLVPELRGAEDVRVEPFGRGWTNNVLRVVSEERRVAVVVRFFGAFTEYLVDRDQEQAVLRANGTRVFGAFLNGCVISYTPGRTLTPEDVARQPVRRMMAKAVAAFHRLRPAVRKRPQFFRLCNQLLNNYPPFSVGDKDGGHVLPAREVLQNEVRFLEKTLARVRGPVVLCHNDLTLKNFVLDEAGRTVRLIDVEYAGWNFQASDLAGLFCEWCGEEMDWSRFPDRTERYEFVKLYLEHYTRDSLFVRDINALCAQVDQFQLLVNLWWAIWGFVNTAISEEPTSFYNYAQRRLDRYNELKKQIDF